MHAHACRAVGLVCPSPVCVCGLLTSTTVSYPTIPPCFRGRRCQLRGRFIILSFTAFLFYAWASSPGFAHQREGSFGNMSEVETAKKKGKTFEQLRFQNQALEVLPIDPALRQDVSHEPISHQKSETKESQLCTHLGIASPGHATRSPAPRLFRSQS